MCVFPEKLKIAHKDITFFSYVQEFVFFLLKMLYFVAKNGLFLRFLSLSYSIIYTVYNTEAFKVQNLVRDKCVVSARLVRDKCEVFGLVCWSAWTRSVVGVEFFEIVARAFFIEKIHIFCKKCSKLLRVPKKCINFAADL